MTTALTTLRDNELATRPTLPIDQHPAAVYLASLSAGSRRTMRGALDTIAGLVSGGQLDALGLDWAALRYQHTAAIRAKLASTYALTTANKMLSALRGTLRAAHILGQIDAETCHRATSIKNIKGTRLPAGRDIPAGELQALVGDCEADQSPAGVRDAAIIGLLYTCGLRRAELVKLDLADVDQDAGALRILGKRNKERLAYPVSGAAVALADWLALRGAEPGPLFWPINKGGKMTPRRLTTQAVYRMLCKRAKRAGIGDLSPHDLRRTFVGDLLDAGADLSTVQKMAGHANVNTTARYDRRTEATKRKAAGRLHLPYRRRVLRE